MGAATTSSSTIVYCIEPGCKGWHTNLAGQHQKVTKNIPSPAGIGNPIAIMYIPVCKNSVQMDTVSSIDAPGDVKEL